MLLPSIPLACRKCRSWKRNFIADFRWRSLEVEYLRPEKIYEAVAADRVDVGFVSYPEPTREIAVVPWRQ